MDDPRQESLRWEVDRGLSAMERIREEWNVLARSGTSTPTADATWFECFSRAFETDENSIFLHELREGPRLLAALALKRSDRLLPAWVATGNAHTPHWAFAMDESRPELAGQIVDHLLQDAELIDFSVIPADSSMTEALTRAARTARRPFILENEMVEVWIDLRGSMQEVNLRLPVKMRRETRRKLRQLEKQGHLQFEVVRGGTQLRSHLDECYELESRTWKEGTVGSAIQADPRTAQFYTDLAVAEAAAGRFALYLLRLDGRLIAFEYSIRAQGRIDMLKPSFDPAFSRFSPGNVLRHKVLEYEVGLGEVTAYHLGRDSQWKRLWVTDTTDLCRLRIYSCSLRARLAYGTGPALRTFLRKSRMLKKLVGRVKALRS